MGAYDSGNTRIDGQALHHAYLWQKGYTYRPGTLVTEAQQIFKCNALENGGDRCGEIPPSSIGASAAWTLVTSTMDELPASEQRYQAYKFKADVDYDGIERRHGSESYVSGSISNTSENNPLNDHLLWRGWNNRSQDSNPSPQIIQRSQLSYDGNVNNYRQWIKIAYANNAVIYNDQVWLCDNEGYSPLDCLDIAPGSYADRGVWQLTTTPASRYEFQHKAGLWKQGVIFEQYEYAIGSDDAVYQCKQWPSSEGCSIYDPAGDYGHIAWDLTNILKTETSDTAAPTTDYGILDVNLDPTSNALYSKYIPGDSTMAGIDYDGLWYQFNNFYQFLYRVQCYDWEDAFQKNYFFERGEYTCHKAEYRDSSNVPFFQYRVFECVSDFCSYNRPLYKLDSVDPYWRMTRADPSKVEITERQTVIDCYEWEIGYPYMSGDFVCSNNMVWVCDWNSENSSSPFAD